ncbi:MAG: ComEC/Rec2 family competence protein [Candidatus Amulumruptor caecigallinarius]|nr:ComEC/Rec2 family competence protein [Candidatus Amulumruptor caecigallinarius]
MKRSNLAYPLCGLIIGILSAMAGMNFVKGCLIIAVSIAIYIILRVAEKNPVHAYRHRNLYPWWGMLVFIGIGVCVTDLHRPFERTDDNFYGYALATGRIFDISHLTSGDRLLVDVTKLTDYEGESYPCHNFTLLLRTDGTLAGYDDVIAFPAEINRITENSNSFNQSHIEYLRNRGILYEATIDGEDITVTGHSATLMGRCRNIRDRLEAGIDYTSLSRNSRNFIIAVLLGDKSCLSDNVKELFSNAGISHMLALSGMHVGIVASIISLLLFPLNFFGMYKLRMIITAILLFAYTMISGAAPSTVRAMLMAAAVIAGILLERKNSSWNSLMLAAFVILAFSPYSILDVGLQLSFMCVASLISFAEIANPVNLRNHPALHKFCGLIVATLVATSSSWMIVAYYFGKVPLMFMPANIVAVPLLPLYIFLILTYLLLSTAGIDFTWLGNTIDYIFDLSTGLLNHMSGMSLNFIPGGWSVIAWTALVSSIAIFLHAKYNRRFALGACGLSAISFLVAISIPAATREEGVIIKDTNRRVEFACKNAGLEADIMPSPGALSIYQPFDGFTIACADCDISNFNPSTPLKCNLLVLSGGYSGNLSTISGKIEPEMVVFHRSIFKKREATLIVEADSMHIPVHSMRKSKSLKIKSPF